MKKDINNYVSFIRQKNGKVKITHSKANEENIYKLLKELGYCQSTFESKLIYLIRNESGVTPVNLIDIKHSFLDLLKRREFYNIPEGIDYTAVLNCYYRENPIKRNKLFHLYMKVELTEADIHNLRLKTDSNYRRKLDCEKLISKLEDWNFSKTVGTLGGSEKQNLYYKAIGNNRYLIFNHFYSDIDSWTATFLNEKHIGIKAPVTLDGIQTNFQLDRDLRLIEGYLN